MKDTESDSYQWKQDEYHRNVKGMVAPDKNDTLRSDEKAKNEQKNGAWWFWSRK